MPSNNKPMLTVLVDGDKRDSFSCLCRRNGRTMASVINQFMDRCLEASSIDHSPDSLGSGQNVDGLLETLGDLKHDLKRLGKERGEQDSSPEKEDFDSTAEVDEECYEPEKDPELSWMYKDIEDLPIELPAVHGEPQVESDKERWIREHEEHYGRPPQWR